MLEKRSMERVKTSLRMSVIDPMTQRVLAEGGRTEDITSHGFLLRTDTHLVARTPYKFKLWLNYYDAIYLEGRIARSKQDSFSQYSSGTFQPLTLGDRIQLNRMLTVEQPAYKRRMFLYSLGVGEIIFVAGCLFGFGQLQSFALAAIVTGILSFLPPF